MADVLPLRAMTMCVFFVSIGMLFDVELVLAKPQLVLILSAFILFGKASVVFLVGVLLRSPPRVAMLAGLALAQVGEFSFVLSGVAVDVGLLTQQEEALLLAASIVSIAVTPLALSFFPRMLAGSRLLEPLQRRLEGRSMPAGPELEEPLRDHVVVVGLGVGGRAVVEAVEQIGMVPLVIELNPATVAFERARGRHILFGDSTSPEVLQHAGVRRAKAVVLVLSDAQAAHRTAELMHNMAPHIPVILRTRYVDEEGAERAIGAEVHSEEFAGAMAIVSAVLRQCRAVDAEQVCDNLTRSHEQLAAADEGALGPPPESGTHLGPTPD
jgi:CPA2 family monovalent cation:H+ antiporter-2